MKLDDGLRGVTRIGLDTAPIIYFVEANPRYDALVTPIFQEIARGKLGAFTSAITLVEALVQPLINSEPRLLQAYRDLLLRGANIATRSIDPAVAERAAGLRAQYQLRTLDALQLAVALEAGCEAFLTNDSRLQRVSELRVLVVDQMEP